MAPPEFFLFPELNTPMKGKRFVKIEEIKEKEKKRAIQKCFEDWKKCWYNCIISDGGYFEGDKIVIDK